MARDALDKEFRDWTPQREVKAFDIYSWQTLRFSASCRQYLDAGGGGRDGKTHLLWYSLCSDNRLWYRTGWAPAIGPTSIRVTSNSRHEYERGRQRDYLKQGRAQNSPPIWIRRSKMICCQYSFEDIKFMLWCGTFECLWSQITVWL